MRRICYIYGMKRPKVVLENYEQVYDYYEQCQPAILPQKLAYAAISAVLRPRIMYMNGAIDDLDQINSEHLPQIYTFNHLSKFDQLIVGSTLHQIAPDDIGNIRTLGADFNFRWVSIQPNKWLSIPPLIDGMGGIPVYRGINYPDANLRPVHDRMFNCAVNALATGQKIEASYEGEVNKNDPTRLRKFRSGISHIACRAAELLDRDIAITPLAFSYAPQKRRFTNPFNTSVCIGRSLFVQPGSNPDTITRQAQSYLQYPVTLAHELYDVT